METKNKIVRYSERFNGMEKASAVLWHYKNVSAAEKEVDGVYVVPAVYLLLHRSFGEKIDRKEAEAVCAEYGANFPGKNALRLLEFACAEIDKALHDAGIYSHIFYEDDVEAACWTADDSAEDETEKRYLLLFVYDADRVEPIKQRFVLVDGCRLYQHCSGVWIKTPLELLLGDKTSNLLLADEKELFLQKEQKLSYIGRCKEIRNDEIIVCDTGMIHLNLKLSLYVMIGYRTWPFVVEFDGDYYTRSVDDEIVLYTDEDCLEKAIFEYTVDNHSFEDIDTYTDHYKIALRIFRG